MTFANVAIDEVNRATRVLQSASGKSINVARALHTLGKQVVATGFVGGDSGAYIRGELDQEGIAHDFVEVPFRTRTCTTVISQADGTTTELVEESQPVEGGYWERLLSLVGSHLGDARAMVLSGSLPPGAPLDFYARCCQLAQGRRVPVMIDGRGEPLRLAVAFGPVMVKPNRSELASTFQLPVEGDEQLRDSIQRLLGMGARSALITMGIHGAVMADGERLWRIASPKVKTDNPIGSGDSVAAGYTAGLVDGLSPMDSAILGIACGAANAMTPTPALIYPEDVQRLRAEIHPVAF
jgi:tagatose 6-phosphate kinase